MKIEIDRNEALRYLGCKEGGVPKDIEAMLSECAAAIEETANVRYVYKVFDAGEVRLMGSDVKKHLEGCFKHIILAATLGIEADNLIRRMQVKDMARAVVLDACGSCGIESVMNRIGVMLSEEFKGENMYVRSRFSPGYGDMPLSQQKELCDLLDTQRKAGIYVTGGNALVPFKSITAITGVSHEPAAGECAKGKCETCNMAADCMFAESNGTR